MHPGKAGCLLNLAKCRPYCRSSGLHQSCRRISAKLVQHFLDLLIERRSFGWATASDFFGNFDFIVPSMHSVLETPQQLQTIVIPPAHICSEVCVSLCSPLSSLQTSPVHAFCFTGCCGTLSYGVHMNIDAFSSLGYFCRCAVINLAFPGLYVDFSVWSLHNTHSEVE